MSGSNKTVPKRRAAPAAPDTAQLDRLCASLRDSCGAVKGRALSKEAVTVGGKIVAFISKGRLVVKLPPQRITALLEAGDATPMRMGNRVMKEWIAVAPAAEERWPQIAEESARYVMSAAPAKKRR